MLFTRTRVLSVKVLTLETFRDMVTTLDKTTLTTKLVPLLAKIKTKEPAVMMATLGVHEAMGAKVDREAIATLVLPQLWSMSMGPLLNATQFDRFMAVIRSLGDRVAKEHGEHLKDVRRLEESQNARVAEMGLNGWDQAAAGGSGGGEVDFEALVKGSSGPKLPANDGWGEGWDADDGLSEMFGTAMATTSAPTVQPRLANSPALGPDSGRPNTAVGNANRLKARPIPSTSFNASAFDTPAALPRPLTMNGLNTNGSMAGSSFAPLQPTQSSFAPMQPTSRAPSTSSRPPASSAPNYNLSLSPQPPAISVSSFAPLQQPTYNPRPPQPQMAQPIAPAIKPPPGYSSGLMQPSKPAAPAWGSNPQGNGDWGDFDPFK
jgi:SCY1-like protein 2